MNSVFLRRLCLLLLCLSVLPEDKTCRAAERPNILWISCEDISSHLGCYGDAQATTPNLDRFAAQGVRYTNAYTVHGVCAPCRTGIITGMYPMSLGANHMRCKVKYPDHVRLFPQYLREAGYYCTNNSKTDYNLQWPQKQVWDESSGRAHWRNRPDPDQPFFAVFNLTMTHESRIWPDNWKKVVEDLPEEQLHRPEDMQIPPLYPDTPDVRAAHARLLDIISVMDARFGQLLTEMEEAGLADNTIVVFWSDHGNGFARAKRWIYDSGTRVPMIVRIPSGLRVAGQGAPGSVSEQLINLIDLGPTMLNLAGIDVPANMTGQPFLGPDVPAGRAFIHGARDRIDERFDMVRSVRNKRFRYVRNLMPWRPALQHVGYSERSVVRQEMRRLKAEGSLDARIGQFLQPTRPSEELYDLEADPWELRNLAHMPEYAETLNELREECDRWQLDSRDAHLIPESLLDAEEQTAGTRWNLLQGDDGSRRAVRLLEAARRAASRDPQQIRQMIADTESDDAAQRWWGFMGLAHCGASGADVERVTAVGLNDESAVVRLAAGRLSHVHGETDAALRVIIDALQDDSDFVRHAALIEADDLGVFPGELKKAVEDLHQTKPGEYVGRMTDYLLSRSGE